jgi:uncharacterized damage-inducible protein DinB
MPVNLGLNDLIEYTAWDRQKWYDWLRQHGEPVLKISARPHGDGRFASVGELVRHIFSAEKRYVERLSGRPLTDAASIPRDDIEALFRFGQQGRTDWKDFVEKFPTHEWDVPQDHKLMDRILTVTPRKIIVHILLHEIRHWAQIATLFRLSGLTDDFHDFLFSPVMGGEFGRQQIRT